MIPPRERIIRVLLLMLARPHKLTRKDLATKFDTSKNTIDSDIQFMKAAGLQYDQDEQHRCAIIPDRNFRELDYLLPLTKDEQLIVNQAIDNFMANDRKARNLRNKVSSLYNFQRLGIRALRRPELEKLNQLERAKKNRVQVKLIAYHSNSNQIRDRHIEAFFITAEHGTIQAYDVEDQKVRHFKLNRFDRVEMTTTEWQYAKHHDRKYTDVFRIANNNQRNVELLLDVYAYNALMENFPNANGDINSGSKPNTFHFQSDVNAKFLGLTNFILANRGHVEILAPEELRAHILKEARGIIEGLEDKD